MDVQYEDQHRVKKVLCAIRGQTMRSFDEEAVATKLGATPGLDIVTEMIARVSAAQCGCAAQAGERQEERQRLESRPRAARRQGLKMLCSEPPPSV